MSTFRIAGVGLLTSVLFAGCVTGPLTSGTSPRQDLFVTLLGKTKAEVAAKIHAAWQQLFYGDDTTERVYYPVGDDMAYIEDIGNGDVRTEGMSYGMMIAVQLDKKAEFDRLWKWARTYMYQTSGPYRGYFAWHCRTNGLKISQNPASDGEEWFVTALFFAAHRWGNGKGKGIFNYAAEANAILHTMLHKNDDPDKGIATNMFDSRTKQVVFVPTAGPESTITDPSYHLPYYYELWAAWADADNAFWKAAASASRTFFKAAANPKTGLMPDYSHFDGTPVDMYNGGHNAFRFDAWRTAMNVAVDYAWFHADKWEVAQSNRLLDFFYREGIDSYGNQYELDGKRLSADHSLGLVATNATAALAATNARRKEFVQRLWDASPPTGKWRYYDGMLYMLGLLHVSGTFAIYGPPAK